MDTLLKTGDQILVYYNQDKDWGLQVKNGKITGKNLQGLALMQVRDEIRKVYENYDYIDWNISKNI